MLAVPEVDSQDALAIIFDDLVVFNEPFFLEDARQVDLHAGGGNVNLVEPRPPGIANPGQHIGDGIGHAHNVPYQLDLVTPGISPLRAMLRKHWGLVGQSDYSSKEQGGHDCGRQYDEQGQSQEGRR